MNGRETWQAPERARRDPDEAEDLVRRTREERDTTPRRYDEQEQARDAALPSDDSTLRTEI